MAFIAMRLVTQHKSLGSPAPLTLKTPPQYAATHNIHEADIPVIALYRNAMRYSARIHLIPDQ